MLVIAVLTLLFVSPDLDSVLQTIFTYLTTTYISLRLGYTAKAGVENYKKIAENYKTIA